MQLAARQQRGRLRCAQERQRVRRIGGSWLSASAMTPRQDRFAVLRNNRVLSGVSKHE
jgi:hypothetical protein